MRRHGYRRGREAPLECTAQPGAGRALSARGGRGRGSGAGAVAVSCGTSETTGLLTRLHRFLVRAHTRRFILPRCSLS